MGGANTTPEGSKSGQKGGQNDLKIDVLGYPKMSKNEVILEHPFGGVFPLVGVCAHNVPIRGPNILGGARTTPEGSKSGQKRVILHGFWATPGTIYGPWRFRPNRHKVQQVVFHESALDQNVEF